MKIRIQNYMDVKAEIEIPDDEDMIVEIISGDEVVTFDKAGKTFDSAELTEVKREINFFDALYIVPKERIKEWNEILGDSYDRKNEFINLCN